MASGVDEPPDGWRRLRERVAAVANDPLEAQQLAISGDDLVTHLGIPPGPAIGRLLAALLDAVVEDPTLNSREQLLALARAMASG
jgi:tRNA nucleotidyltransferase (CCA-adding enzyme)